jgi:hypothetical protein
MKKKSIGLIVVNQDTSFDIIQRSVQAMEFVDIVLLSTHKYFYTEKIKMQNLSSGKNFIFIYFGEFFSDEEMLEYDGVTFQSLDINAKNHWEGPRQHKKVMVYLRNMRIHEELIKSYDIGQIFYWATLVETHNLGISHRYWKGTTAKRLVPNYKHHLNKRIVFSLKKLKGFEALGQTIFRFCQKMSSRTLFLVDFGNEYFLFHSLRRLHFKENTKIMEVQFNPMQHLSLRKGNKRDDIFERFVKHIAKEICLPVHWSTALHEYPRLREFVDAPKIPLFIFEDAFRPSNYPEFVYSKMYFLGKMVVRDMYDYAYFKGSGKEVIKPYGPLKISYFNIDKAKIDIVDGPNVVILSINHTGDWTWLINRSDTDKLIENFAFLAEENPALKFIIRPHPTMDTAIAEGINSIKRIEEFVNDCKLDNISVSDVTMDEDWERGDIFISEYSLSVLDAMRRGKLGFFMNPTSRRSFVQDFIDIGFPHTSSLEEMSLMLKSMIEQPRMYRKKIFEASLQYNKNLKEFLEID